MAADGEEDHWKVNSLQPVGGKSGGFFVEDPRQFGLFAYGVINKLATFKRLERFCSHRNTSSAAPSGI